jgi:proline iminopeptidase
MEGTMRTLLLAAFAAIAFALPTVQPTSAETGFVTAPDGAKLFYEREGKGPAVVVPLHLFTYDWMRPLADRFTVIGYDVRNRGRSSYVKNTATLTIQQDVADLETLRKHLKLEKMDLIGHSYTGLMVYLYALAHPNRVRRIVQLGPVPPVFGTKYRAQYVYTDDVGGEADMAEVMKLRESGVRETNAPRYCLAVWNVWTRALVADPAHVSKLDGLASHVCLHRNEWLTNFNRHLEHHFASVQKVTIDRNAMRRFQTPVLTIHGDKDRNAPYGAGREWAFALGNARLLTVPGTAHAVFAERPDIVEPAIRTFLGGDWPAGAERVTESPVE